mmetsp:Transcript_63058/g.205773  ORF Transcript_63058/g.205773 Transcript_63058/m.205773 type:complete len:222 (-) Transcript_63058:237-902(-)
MTAVGEAGGSFVCAPAFVKRLTCAFRRPRERRGLLRGVGDALAEPFGRQRHVVLPLAALGAECQLQEENDVAILRSAKTQHRASRKNSPISFSQQLLIREERVRAQVPHEHEVHGRMCDALDVRPGHETHVSAALPQRLVEELGLVLPAEAGAALAKGQTHRRQALQATFVLEAIGEDAAKPPHLRSSWRAGALAPRRRGLSQAGLHGLDDLGLRDHFAAA